VPTCEDVLAIRSIDEAFDLSSRKVRKRFTRHAEEAMDDEAISKETAMRVIGRGTPKSKDIDDNAGRQIGINFEADADFRRIRVKVSWELRYFVATVHTV
jgi:hypothetical protein